MAVARRRLRQRFDEGQQVIATLANRRPRSLGQLLEGEDPDFVNCIQRIAAEEQDCERTLECASVLR